MMQMKKISCLALAVLLFTLSQFTVASTSPKEETVPVDKISQVLEDTMKKAQVPGASAVIIQGDTTEYLNYGTADGAVSAGQSTYYELGSMSKAFTALGVLLLEEEGQLSLSDPVTKYLPWFQVAYRAPGEKAADNVPLTLSHLFHHTSGLPFSTLGDMPTGESEDTLEKTVRTLAGTQLDYYPGEKYQYATMNYDVLGLVIQTVTGETYEQFMEQKILGPLGLHNTFLFREQAKKSGTLAKGYKMDFLKARIYDAPRYRGNTPAGYIITNAEDMGRWMRIQLGLIAVPETYQRLITRSHLPDESVQLHDDYGYAGGWDVHTKDGTILHGGNNPNFSSMIILLPDKKTGICILTNMNSNAAAYVAGEAAALINGTESGGAYWPDIYLTVDKAFSIITVISAAVGLTVLCLMIWLLVGWKKGKREKSKLTWWKLLPILLFIGLLVFFVIGACRFPVQYFQGLNWKTVNVWGSPFCLLGCISGIVSYGIVSGYCSFLLLTQKSKTGKKGGGEEN